MGLSRYPGAPGRGLKTTLTVLGDDSQNKLILGASWTAQSQPAELQDALEVRKSHLDLLALAP
jgi:hypothetical protein